MAVKRWLLLLSSSSFLQFSKSPIALSHSKYISQPTLQTLDNGVNVLINAHKLYKSSCFCRLDQVQLFIYYFTSAAVAVDSSHMTASLSALWSRFSPLWNFVNGHVSTMWFMVCRWPQSQESDWYLQFGIPCITDKGSGRSRCHRKKVAHTRLPSLGFRS